MLSKVVKTQVTEQAGNDGNGEISGRENIFKSESQALPLAICTSELAHQKIGIEQEDYETDLNYRLPCGCQPFRLFRIIRNHRLTIAKATGNVGTDS